LNRVFIDLYLDEDVSVALAALLRGRGFRVTTTQEAGLVGATDAEQLAFATSHGSAILTHNRVHFEALAREYFAGGKSHAGIIIAVRRNTLELARRLFTLLNPFTADEIENQIRYL
jgi:predicted nuclease of predicted toxin-antitoxin system